MTRLRLSITAAAMLLLSLGALAQQKTDFSGKWTPDGVRNGNQPPTRPANASAAPVEAPPEIKVSGGVVGGVVGGIPPPPSPEGPLRVGGDIKAPRLIHRVEPVYPVFAQKAHVQGNVYLDAVIGKDGSVKDVKVQGGNEMLTQAAIDAVKQWRYERTLLGGQPVEVALYVQVFFTLGDRAGVGTMIGADFDITQTDRTLTVSRVSGSQKIDTVYNLDGSVSENGLGLAKTVSTARWDGAKLVISTSTNGPNGIVTLVVTWSIVDGDLLQETAASEGQPARKTYFKRAG